MKEIKGFIIDSLEKEIRFHKTSMTKIKRSLKDPYPVSFILKLAGSKIEHKANNLNDIIKKIDNDGYYILIACLNGGKQIEIPKKYWVNILKMERKNEILIN